MPDAIRFPQQYNAKVLENALCVLRHSLFDFLNGPVPCGMILYKRYQSPFGIVRNTLPGRHPVPISKYRITTHTLNILKGKNRPPIAVDWSLITTNY